MRGTNKAKEMKRRATEQLNKVTELNTSWEIKKESLAP
jgi:hypothetical protein